MVPIPNQLKVAAATILVVGGVSHSMLPSSQDKTDPAAAQREYHRQYSQNRRRELDDRRVKANREAEAFDRDHLRPAEVRPKHQDTATQAVRRVLRRKP